MASTYKHTPISFPDIMALIVAEVAANLGYDIKFKHGTWVVVQAELIADSVSTDSNVKNWNNCICLIHDTDEKPADRSSEFVSPRLVIVTKSEETWKSQKRNDVNYIPKLYPMWAELGQVIADSTYFLGYINPILPKRDLYHIGKEGSEGKDGYLLPKVLDGLIIEGASLRLNMDPMCSYEAPNLCQLTPCQYGREAFYQNVIKNLTIAGVGTDRLMASINDFYFVDASGGLPPPFAPEIDWGSGGPIVAMDAPAPPATVPFTSQLSSSALMADGFYVGRIFFNDSWIDFYYLVSGGIVVKCTSLVDLDYDFDLSCDLYPNQPINSTLTYTISKTTGDHIIVGYAYDIFGVQKFTEVINPAVGTITKVMEYTDDFTNALNWSIAHKISRLNGQAPLQVVFQIKTRCKTQF